MSDRTGPSPGRRLALLGALALGLFALFRVLPVGPWLTSLQVGIERLGPAGAVVFAALYVLATVLFLPGSAITILAGVLYGPWRGTALVSAASTLGAAAAFLVGRYAARPAVERWLESSPRLRALDSAVAKSGWRIVLLTRLTPALPFNLLNYAFGLTRVGFWPYVGASWLGMLPGTALYVGSAAAASAVATGAWRRPELWLALAGTVAVTAYVTRLARQALASSEVVKE